MNGLRLQILCNKICGKVKLPHIKVVLSNENNDFYLGEYFYETHWIRIYTRVHNKIVNLDSMKDTLCHELAHYYQFYYYNNLTHDSRFDETIKHLLSLQ